MSIAERALPPLRPGEQLSVRDFLHRWEAMPGLKFAELIDGVVYVPSPVTSKHGRTESRVVTWLGTYVAGTPVCDTGSQSTWLMLESAPQPDCYLWIRPDLARLIQTVERGLQSAAHASFVKKLAARKR
jgi:Uma2 family endonuclease